MVDVANAFGRGTHAGSLLYTLYHKPTKASTFDAELAQKLAAMRELRDRQENPKPKVVPKSKTKVKVPRMTGRVGTVYNDHDDVRMYRFRPNRKPEAKIKAECASEIRLPPIDKKFIAPGEKDRLAKLMEYDGEMPEELQEPAAKRAPRPCPPPPQPAELGVQELFDSVLEEIQERKEFLAEMKALGQHKDIEAKVKQEIAQRVVELKKLDKLLKGE
jgi:hypothetical protein